MCQNCDNDFTTILCLGCGKLLTDEIDRHYQRCTKCDDIAFARAAAELEIDFPGILEISVPTP